MPELKPAGDARPRPRGSHGPRRGGFVLLPVTLLLAVIAAAAWMVSREGVAGADRVVRAGEGQLARYVAEAGLAHAEWAAGTAACSGYGLPDTAFGAHVYSAVFTPAAGSPVTIAATATLDGGAQRTVTRSGVRVYEGAQTQTLQPDAATGSDTFLDQWFADTARGDALRLEAQNGSGSDAQRPLLRFDLSSIPAEASVIEATLELYLEQNTVDPVAIAAHRVTAAWSEAAATWNERDAGVAWGTPGGDYDPTSLATTPVAPASGIFYAWGVTEAVQAWHAGAQPNHGVILIAPPGSNQNTFSASDGSTPAQWPRLTVTYACECGVSPSGILDQQPGAGGVDTHLRAGVPDTAHGASPDLLVSDKNATVDRALLRFDVSTIPAGAAVTSATLHLELLSVGSSDPASVSAHRVERAWNESQATWNVAQAGTAWTAPGGDFDPVAVDSVAVQDTAPGARQLDLSALVQDWVDGAQPNRGVLLLASPGLNKASFASSDHATTAFRPRLEVTYTCPCGVPCGSGPAFGTDLLMVVLDPAAPTARESAKKALAEASGFTVTLIDEGASAADFRAAALANDAIWVTGDVVIGGSGLGSELTGAHLGVVNERDVLTPELGVWAVNTSASFASLNVDDTSHHVTGAFSAGPLAVFVSAESGAAAAGGPAPGAAALGSVGGETVLAAVDKTAALWTGDPAPGRRLQLPWRNSYDPDLLTADGQTLLRRALEWAATPPEVETAAYLDRFESQSCDPAVDYRNSDGVLAWSGSPWVEASDGGNPCNGDATVEADGGGSALRLTGADTRIERAVDLNGATWATLHLRYRRQGFDDAADAVLVEASDDGGTTWTEVGRIEGPGTDAGYGSLGMDVTAFADVDSAIRLRTSGLTAGGADPDRLYVDDLRIETDSAGSGLGGCAATLADDFESGGYGGSTGGVAWTAAWAEIAEADGPASGNVTVGALAGSQSLRVENSSVGAWRGADLSAFASATLNVDYRRDSLDKKSEKVTVELSSNGGGSWTEIAALEGAATDTDWQLLSVDVSAYLGTDTRIRFVSSSQMGGGDAVHFDAVSLCLN